ncbi:hypothetical protein ACFYQT_40150 [Streptomyces tibetensis]|uniref:Uncharacterized protein n=1 Tax=Streptomyces tibetensis TaxID=2382123 RepID=A0ABW6NCS8_9ACTN
MAGHVLDGTELGDLLDDLTNGTNIRPGIHLLAAAIRTLAEDATTGALDLPATQLASACLDGSPDGIDAVGAIGLLQAWITNPNTNPALRALPLEQQKEAQLHGELAAHALTDPDLRTAAAEANAALDPRKEVPAVKCLTDEERKELSKKVADANKKSTNRPR